MCTDNIIPPNKIETAVKLLKSLGVVQEPLLEFFDFAELFGFPKVREDIYEELIKNNEIKNNPDVFADILSVVYSNNYDYSRHLLSSYKDSKIPISYIAPFISVSGSSRLFETLSSNDVMKKMDYIEQLKQRALKNPENYVNGVHSQIENESEINSFFVDVYAKLFDMANIYDKETIDVLMRKRLKVFKFYLSAFSALKNEDFKLIKNMINCVNLYNKPFTPTQKIEFIDLLTAYNDNNMDKSNIETMINNGKIDLVKLNTDLFIQFMKNAGLSDDEISSIPKEKLLSWDKRYAHLLSKNNDELERCEEKECYLDILRASNLYEFETYIADESNNYGKANAKTKRLFEEINLNYENWIHPLKEFERIFVSNDKNNEVLKQISKQVSEDMNTFMQTPVKGYIKKQFPTFVKDDKFILPADISSNKNKLLSFVQSLVSTEKTSKMSAVWNRANTNLSASSIQLKDSAKRTLTVLEHLNQRLKDLYNLSEIETTKDLNLKIKMWDRFPQKDLFQGNYSQCCIGIGEINGNAISHYLMNTAFNMVEIIENEKGDTIGNALCYFVKTDDGKPALIVDNIEIANNFKSSDLVGIKLRNAIKDYLEDVAKSVTGNDYTPIYIGNSYNDITTVDLPCVNDKAITFLGEIECEKVYLDMFGKQGSWSNKNELSQICNMSKLN